MDDDKTEWVDGKKGFGKAFNPSGKGFMDKDLNQRTGRIEVPHDLGAPNALSVSLWFYIVKDGEWNYFMDFRDPGSWFARQPTNIFQFNGQGTVETGQYPRNEWAHVVVLADSSSTKYYVNGKPTGTPGGASILTIGTKLHIGSRFSKAESLLGYLDDIALWDRIISENEIAQLGGAPVTGGAAVYPDEKLSTK